MAPIDIPDADYGFIAAAARQLHPTMRETFATRVHAALQDICEPGPGAPTKPSTIAPVGAGVGVHGCGRIPSA
jgi:hypothetical protein